MIPFGDDISAKSFTDSDFLALGTRPALWVDGVLTAPTSSSFLDDVGAQAELFKWVFRVVQSSASGWTKLGTFTGSAVTGSAGGSRFRIELTGKQDWNDQSFPGHAIIYGSSNFIPTDSGQIAGGAGWVEFSGSGSVATEVRLVRQSGYVPQTFDVLIRQGDLAFVQWVVEVTSSTKSSWATDVQYNVADPGTGSNVMQVLRKLAWESDNLPISAFAKTFLDDADASAVRSTLGAAPLASPAFTGIPTAPTASAGTNTTQIASTAYVRAAIAALVDSSPGALDTLNELAAALGDDPNFATTMTNSLAGKVAKAGDSMTGKLTFAASASGFASLRVPVGSTPSAPEVGDVWHNGTNFLYQNSFGSRYLVGASGLTPSALPRASSAGFLIDSRLSENATEISLSSGLFRFRNPNLTDPVLAFTTAADTASAFVAYMDGKFEWGPGGSTARNVNLYFGGTSKLKTDDIMWAVGGFRATAYNSADLGGTGPGVEVHYDAANTRARILGYDRTTAARIQLAIDGSPIDFYADGNLRATLDASGNFLLHNYSGNRALVSNGSKHLIETTTTAAQIQYLDTLTGNAQDQFNSKPHVNDVNIGETFDSATFDPFADRFTNFNTRGGVRTWYGIGPFAGAKEWYNVVDIRHRNGGGDGASGYGGELAWGMLGWVERLAFRSRSIDGTPTAWTEVWTKAEISDANMPRLDANQIWTGENTFFDDLSFRSGGFDYRSGPGGMGYGSGGFFAKEYNVSTEPYNGLAMSYSGSATRASLGVHSSPNSSPTAGFQTYSGDDSTPPTADILGLTSVTFSSDLHAVTSSDLTMTKNRAKINSTTARNVTLPSPANSSLAIVMVETDATTGYHSVYPPSGSQIYWTDYTGTSRYTVPSGGGAGFIFRVTRGMYWFVSDGTYWYAMSPARN